MTARGLLLLNLAMFVLAGAARAEEPAAAAIEPLDEAALADTRGGLQTHLGVDIGFGASVRTYVDGSLALETRLTWTADGPVSSRVFEGEAAAAAGAAGGLSQPVDIAKGVRVVHDLTENRIASVVLNTANDRTIRQETDVTLHLPQLPELQQRIAAERITQALQAIAPQAAGIGK
jgi:hypothetical protein